MTPLPSSNSAPRNLAAWIIGSAVLLVLLILIVLVMWGLSGVSGSEFSPTHFQTRSFRFAQIPGLQWQIQGVTRSSTTDSTSKYLIANNLIQVPATAPNRWDLILISMDYRMLFGSTGHDADPSFLTAYLQGRGGSGVDWEQWSKDHAKAAAVLWPFVQQLAIDRLYLMLPRVFELAENETDPVKLKQDLDTYFANELPSFCDDLFHAGYEQEAISALQSAMVLYPEQESFADALDRLMPQE